MNTGMTTSNSVPGLRSTRASNRTRCFPVSTTSLPHQSIPGVARYSACSRRVSFGCPGEFFSPEDNISPVGLIPSVHLHVYLSNAVLGCGPFALPDLSPGVLALFSVCATMSRSDSSTTPLASVVLGRVVPHRGYGPWGLLRSPSVTHVSVPVILALTT